MLNCRDVMCDDDIDADGVTPETEMGSHSKFESWFNNEPSNDSAVQRKSWSGPAPTVDLGNFHDLKKMFLNKLFHVIKATAIA